MIHGRHPTGRTGYAVLIALGCLLPGLVSPVHAMSSPPTYDIPLLRDVKIDGVTNDWAEDAGMRVDILAPAHGTERPSSNLLASARIGWNEAGLLLLVRVTDNAWVERQDEQGNPAGDSIEAWLGKGPGSPDRCRWVFAPGMSENQPLFSSTFHDLRKANALRSLPAEARGVRLRRDPTCLAEIELPWEALAVAPETGRIVAFQLRVNDVDGPDDPPYQVAWHPGADPATDPDPMHRLRLSARAAAPVHLAARASYRWPASIGVSLLAAGDRTGGEVSIMSMGRILSEGVLGEANGHAAADLRFAVSDLAGFERWVDAHLDGELAGVVRLPIVRGDPMTLRLLDDPEESDRMPAAFRPALLTDDVETTAVIAVDTDVRSEVLGSPPPVAVEVLAPGGRSVAREEVPMGETVSFGTRGWEDGPYEIRLSARIGDRTRYRYLPVYRGNWLALSADIMTESLAIPKDDLQPRSLVYRLMKTALSARLDDAAEPGTGDATGLTGGWRDVHGLLLEHAEIRLGTNAVVRPGGAVRLAWIDAVDGSAQYAMVYLPPDHAAGVNRPLIVELHGYNPLNPVYAEWPGIDARHHAFADSYGAIVLRPHGRGNEFYEGIGELDVLAALDRTLERFPVDPDRVYLAGESMGAGGSIRLASRHPHLFAAIAPIAGAGRDYRVRTDPDQLRRLTPRERFRHERRSSYVQAEGLASTPVFINVGEADEFGFAKEARFFVDLLQRWGYDVRYREHPGKGHWDLDCRDEVGAWLLAQTRRRDPPRVRVRSAQLKSARAHWVHVRQRANPFAFIHVDARAIDRHTIRLSTENVLQVTLSPGAGVVDHTGPVRILWNGDERGPHAFGDGPLTLTSPAYRPGDIVKTASREGPMEEFWTTPFAIVAGTMAKDPRVDRFLQARAEALRESWRDRHHVEPRFFLDSQISEKEIRDFSLLLLGGPGENLVTQIFEDRLPLAIEGSRITIDGRTFEAPDASVCMVYPHPLNQDRYILLNAGTSADGLFHAAVAPGDRDFAVVDGRGEPLSGLFDYRWRFTERYLDYGDATRRLASPPRRVPRHMTAASGGQELLLGDLLALRTSGSFLAMQRGLDARGRPFTLGKQEFGMGIGVRARPGTECSAVYDLAAGSWKRMKATVGIRMSGSDPSSAAPRGDATAVTFLVLGDEKALYESPVLSRRSPPAEIDVDVSGVQLLKLLVRGETAALGTTTTAIWGDPRLLK